MHWQAIGADGTTPCKCKAAISLAPGEAGRAFLEVFDGYIYYYMRRFKSFSSFKGQAVPDYARLIYRI